jgi:hypothetical protein
MKGIRSNSAIPNHFLGVFFSSTDRLEYFRARSLPDALRGPTTLGFLGAPQQQYQGFPLSMPIKASPCEIILKPGGT